MNKSFLVLFFKKEPLSFLLHTRRGKTVVAPPRRRITGLAMHIWTFAR
jgi:hypothetical protein